MKDSFQSDTIKTFASYFDDKKSGLKELVVNSYQRLKEGHIVTEVDAEQANLLATSPFVSADPDDLSKPFVLQGQHFYFQRYYKYESQIIAKIKALIASGKGEEEKRKAQLLAVTPEIRSLFGDFISDGDAQSGVNWQLVAAVNALLRNFAIITGGPGTGKTTTVAKLLSVLCSLNGNVKVSLCAQTGKAAGRLKESLNQAVNRLQLSVEAKEWFFGIEPLTIHRLLGYKSESIDFKHDVNRPLPFDVVIVDESSMIDVPLMAKLFQAVPDTSRLILLGDQNQLASVEAGSVFGDLCRSAGDDLNAFSDNDVDFFNTFILDGRLNQVGVSRSTNELLNCVVELRKSYRFSDTEGLGEFSKKVIQSEEVDVTQYQQTVTGQGVQVVSDGDEEVIHYLLKYQSYIKEKEVSVALKKLNGVRVLCAVREGEAGVHYWNDKVESLLVQYNLISTDKVFYENRPLMITKNDYNLGLFNGDIGVCRKNEAGEIRVYFEDAETGIKDFDPSFLQAYETVFAMTIHKSQGSEFQDVVVVLPGAEALGVTRELLYTGITRAKEKVLLVADQEKIDAALASKVDRVSGIKKRLNG